MGGGERVTTPWRRSRAALALAAAVWLAAGCSAGARVDDTPEGRVRTLLRQRAALLAAGDVEGYLAAVDPAAREEERELAEGAAAAPVSWANASFHPRAGQRSTASSFRDATVEVVYRYEGLPEDNLFRFSVEYDLELRDGAWRVTRFDLPTGGDRPPIWATGPVGHTRSEHFLALFRPGLAGAAEALDAAEEARRNLAGLSRFSSDPVHLVLLAGTDEEYVDLKGGPDEGEVALARASFSPLSRPEARHVLIKSHEVVLGDAAVATEEGGGQAPATVVFQHELAHLALSSLNSPFTPPWVVEGAAMYLAGERRVGAWRFGLDRGLFGGMSIGAMVGNGLADGGEYAYANAAVLHLVEEYGADRFFDFYRRFQPLSPTPRFAGDPTGEVLSGFYELSVEELDERAKAYIVRAAGGG